jgi:glycosyltransferase involved in cell wall biosynthesis
MPVWRPDRAWLAEAVRSALEQRGCEVELIVVDDGNDPPVQTVLADVHDPRVKHVRVTHGGVSHARNAGTAAATAPFVRYIDADDVCDADSTARLLRLAADGGIAYEDTLVCDEQLRPVRRITSRLTGDIAVQCLLGRFDSRHVSMLFPRAVVDRAGPWDTHLRVREDFDFVLRCLEHAPAVPGHGTATYYRRHAASATRSESALREAQAATRLIHAAFFARNPELRRSPVRRAARTAVHTAEGRTALALDRPLEAARHALALLPLAPRDAARLGYRALRTAARVSRAATARTTARARQRLLPRAR